MTSRFASDDLAVCQRRPRGLPSMSFARAGDLALCEGAAPDPLLTNPLPRRRGRLPRTRGGIDTLCPRRQARGDAKTRPRSLLAGIEDARSRQGRRRSPPGGHRSPGTPGSRRAGTSPVAGTAWSPRLSWTWAAAGRSGGHRDAAGGRDAGVALDSSLSRGTPGRWSGASGEAGVPFRFRPPLLPPPPHPNNCRGYTQGLCTSSNVNVDKLWITGKKGIRLRNRGVGGRSIA